MGLYYSVVGRANRGGRSNRGSTVCLWLYFLFFFMRRRIEKAHGHWTKFDYYTMTCFCRSSTTTMTISVLHIHIESSKRKKPSEIRWNISLSFEIFLGNKKCFLQTQTNYVFLPVNDYILAMKSTMSFWNLLNTLIL